MQRVCLALAMVFAPQGWAEASPDEAVQLARTALASELAVVPASISLASVEQATWPDAGLGCGNSAGSPPEAVHGYRVLARAAGRLHVVHVAGGRAVICGTGLSVASAPAATTTHTPPVEPGDPASSALVAQARADLARRLSVAESDIALSAFKSVVWPDGGFGCPRPGVEYTQVPREGVLIRFEVGGRTFDYHGGEGRAPFLCETK